MKALILGKTVEAAAAEGSRSEEIISFGCGSEKAKVQMFARVVKSGVWQLLESASGATDEVHLRLAGISASAE